MNPSLRRAILATLAVALIAPLASATIINFSNITNNGPIDVTGQLSLDVTSPAAGEVLFKFMNAGPEDSFIGQIYFDDNNTRLSNMIVNTNPETTAGVSFEVGGRSVARHDWTTEPLSILQGSPFFTLAEPSQGSAICIKRVRLGATLRPRPRNTPWERCCEMVFGSRLTGKFARYLIYP